MAKRRRHEFPCGHLGQGSRCNRCYDGDKLARKAADMRASGSQDEIEIVKLETEAERLLKVG